MSRRESRFQGRHIPVNVGDHRILFHRKANPYTENIVSEKMRVSFSGSIVSGTPIGRM